MFGKNSIVGKKYFKDAGKDKLFVTTMFFTIQGEGPYRGMPAFFIRLAKCNLACSFCDTYFDDGDWMTFDEIDEKIDKMITEHFKGNVPDWAINDFQFTNEGPVGNLRNMVLVITGGEPMLQDNLVPFLERMQFEFAATQIESNGIQFQPIPESTTLVVSPKCSEKNGKAIKYLKPNEDVLKRVDALKFVISADPNSPYHVIPDWAFNWLNEFKYNAEFRNKQIFISPMNMYLQEPQRKRAELVEKRNEMSLEERSVVNEVISFWEKDLLDQETNQKNHEYAAKYCLENGLILNLQLHLYASLA